MKRKFTKVMSKVCLIYQPAGIGDILFCQGIAKNFVDRGYRVIFPILNRLMFLQDYINNPGVEFVDEALEFEYKDKYNQSIGSYNEDNFSFVNTDTSTSQIPSNSPNGIYIMPSKYEHIGLNFREWSSGFNLIRNKAREDKLFYDILKLTDKDEYAVCNNKYGTPPNTIEYPIPEIESKRRIVHMEFIDGTNIMDWCKVLERANGIVTVDTCILYIMTMLKITHYDMYYCYLRPGWTKEQYNEITPFAWKYLN